MALVAGMRSYSPKASKAPSYAAADTAIQHERAVVVQRPVVQQLDPNEALQRPSVPVVRLVPGAEHRRRVERVAAQCARSVSSYLQQAADPFGSERLQALCGLPHGILAGDLQQE